MPNLSAVERLITISPKVNRQSKTPENVDMAQLAIEKRLNVVIVSLWERFSSFCLISLFPGRRLECWSHVRHRAEAAES